VKEQPLDDIGIYDADDEDDSDFGPPDGYGPDLGPDERDFDLIDGSWEQRYYRGETRSRDWNTIGIGIALLVLIAMLLPAVLVLTR
jgi:hypothetical protein